MYNIKGSVIDSADRAFELYGEYSGKTEALATKQFKAHVHKLYGFKVFIRDIQATKIENKNNGGIKMEKTVKELKETLKAAGITGYSNKVKTELESLVEDLKSARQTAVTEVEEKQETTKSNNVAAIAKHKAVVDSLMRCIAHPTKIGKFTDEQGRYMYNHRSNDYSTPIFISSGEFVVAGFKSARYEVVFVCNITGVQKVVKYDSVDNKAEVSWEPSMGAYVKPVNYEKVFPVTKLATSFGDMMVEGLIDIKVIKKDHIEGSAKIFLAGKEIEITYAWDKTKGYAAPVVYINKVIAKDARFKIIVMGLLDAYKNNLKTGKLANQQVAIANNDVNAAEPEAVNTKARNKKGMASLFEE